MLYGVIYIPNATSFGALIRAVFLGESNSSVARPDPGLGDDSPVR